MKQLPHTYHQALAHALLRSLRACILRDIIIIKLEFGSRHHTDRALIRALWAPSRFPHWRNIFASYERSLGLSVYDCIFQAGDRLFYIHTIFHSFCSQSFIPIRLFAIRHASHFLAESITSDSFNFVFLRGFCCRCMYFSYDCIINEAEQSSDDGVVKELVRKLVMRLLVFPRAVLCHILHIAILCTTPKTICMLLTQI